MLNPYISTVPGWPLTASSSHQVAKYYFWWENRNPDPHKPISRHTWRHINIWSGYLYLDGQIHTWTASSSLQTSSQSTPKCEILLLMLELQFKYKNPKSWNIIIRVLVIYLQIWRLDLLEQPPSCPTKIFFWYLCNIISFWYSDQFLLRSYY